MKNTDQTTAYSLSLKTTAYPVWDMIELSAYELMLGPGESAEITVTSTIEAPGTYAGMVVVYDMFTGCTYDRLAVTVTVA
jgi:hypothetical protein